MLELVQHIHNEAGGVAEACTDIEPRRKKNESEEQKAKA